MKTKHTPGPWDNIDLMELLEKGNDEIEANLTLMNAAPEMLEALIEISEGKGRYDLDPIQHAANCIEDMKALALEVIKKATS